MHFISALLNDTLWFLALVFVMLLWADYLNTRSHGRIASYLQKNPKHQYLSGTLLGSIPGCFGSFINVSLYTHRLYSFGALLAGMIATTGDEGFFMLALFPKTAWLLFGCLALFGLCSGWIFDKAFPRFAQNSPLFHELPMHGEDTGHHGHHHPPSKPSSLPASALRIILCCSVLILAGVMSAGWIHHPEFAGHEHETVHLEDTADHAHAGEHEEDHEGHEKAENLFTLAALLSSLWIFLRASDHYLREHIWEHIIRHHLPKFALWTGGTLLVVQLAGHNLELNQWLTQNPWQTLILGCLIGLLPVSGPHITFTILFSQGAIPFAVLWANSLVQSGHGVLPLLPYPKRDVLVIKGVKLVLGLLTGAALLALGF